MSQPMALLIVEDNPADARLVEILMREHEATRACELRRAETLAEALVMLAGPGSPPSAVLLDLSLPDSSGLDTLRSFKAAFPGLPVVVLSGQADEQVALQAVRQGAQDYLVKGRFTADLLARSLRYAVERTRIEAELREQREAISHLSRLSALGEMAATFAHELNQPLSAIVISAEQAASAARAGHRAAAQDELAFINTQARRAADIIRRIRGFAARSGGQVTETDMPTLVSESCDLVRPELAQRAVRLKLSLNPCPPVAADGQALKQVLVNLMLNGMEAMAETPAGDRVLEISVSAQADSTVRVAVSDAGKGIQTEPIERVLDAFFTTKPNGLGLGLAISRSIVEAHAGRLMVERNPGRGVTFWFTLPSRRPGGVKDLAP